MYENQERGKVRKMGEREMKQIKQHILKSSELDYRQFVTALRRRARRCGGGGWQRKKQTEKMFRVHL